MQLTQTLSLLLLPLSLASPPKKYSPVLHGLKKHGSSYKNLKPFKYEYPLEAPVPSYLDYSGRATDALAPPAPPTPYTTATGLFGGLMMAPPQADRSSYLSHTPEEIGLPMVPPPGSSYLSHTPEEMGLPMVPPPGSSYLSHTPGAAVLPMVPPPEPSYMALPSSSALSDDILFSLRKFVKNLPEETSYGAYLETLRAMSLAAPAPSPSDGLRV